MSTPKIEIDGVEINYDTLSEKSRYFHAQTVDLSRKIELAQFELAQLEASKQVFDASFVEAVSEDNEE